MLLNELTCDPFSQKKKKPTLQSGACVPECHTWKNLNKTSCLLPLRPGLVVVFPLTVRLLPLLAFGLNSTSSSSNQTSSSRTPLPPPLSNYVIIFIYRDCVAPITRSARVRPSRAPLPPSPSSSPLSCLPICCELRINLSLRRSVNRCGVNHSPGFPFISPSSQ